MMDFNRIVNLVPCYLLFLQIKKFNLEKLRQAIPIFGAKLWNKIPDGMIDTCM